MKNIVRIKGEKINLCLIRNDDEAIELYTKWMADEDIIKYLGSQRIQICTHDDEKAFADMDLGNYMFRFNIVISETDTLIGNCDIDITPHSRNATLGICIGEREYHNKGYGKEAIKLMTKFCFEQLNMHNVRMQLNSDNIGAYKCYKAAGFMECSIEREEAWIDNHWTDCITMQMLESDYAKLKERGEY